MLELFTVDEARGTILRRRTTFDPDVNAADATVRAILADVHRRGDAALRDWTAKLDGVRPDRLTVSAETIRTAADRIPADLRAALESAADRIRRFHACQPLPDWTTDTLGGTLGQRVTPIRRVGVYVPGGTAPLPSSLLMSVIPAQVAGCRDIVVATPPQRNGTVADVILAAAAIVGIDTVYTLGGAQAIAALAFGTDAVPAVDKIVGPGNRYVTLAKQQVYGIVGIDGLYGPTETVVVADESADPTLVAADLLAQSEHDVLATAILFTPSRALARAVQAAVARQLEDRRRADIITRALTDQGGIVLTADMAEACALASEFAAEHTCIATADPQRYVDAIPNAGGLFIGERSFEVLGDYIAGPSHVMPTGGTARFASPLNVLDFVKISSIIALDDATSARLSPVAARIASAEALDAHAYAARLRAE